MKEIFESIMQPVSLTYCDYIVDKIKQCMDTNKDRSGLIMIVGHVQFDLTPEGAFLSTKKTLEVVDVNNKRYKITVEEA